MMKPLQFVFRSAPGLLTKNSLRPNRARLVLAALVLLLIAPPVLGQALPAAEAAPISTGFALPRVAGTLNYSVSASESLTWGYFGSQGAFSATNLSGDVGFLSGSKLHPFSLVFSGGHSFSSSGQPSYNFLNLAMSQVLNLKRWTIVGSDSVSYLPGTPTTGLSGIPGVGDLGVSPVQVGVDTGQGILTAYSDRVANTASGSLQRQVTGKTSFNAFGSYSVLRFLGTGAEGLDDNSVGGGAGINHQMNARNSFGANYSYSEASYPGNSAVSTEPSYASQTASGQYTHQFTRRLSVTAAAGPQWTKVDATGASEGVSVYANASASYQAKLLLANVFYSRSTNAGFGAIAGALSQGGGIAFSRTIARVWNCSASGSYTTSSGLPGAGANTAAYGFDTTVAGVQASRAIVRSISIYGSYTFEHQTNGGGGSAVDVYSGREQVVGFGVTYSPASLHVGRQ